MSWLFSASLRVRRSITSSKIHTHTKKRFAAAGKYGVRHMGEREPPHTPPNSSAHQLRDPSRPISAIAAQRICFHCFSFWARSATTLQYKIQHSTDIVIHLHFICIFSGLLYGNELLSVVFVSYFCGSIICCVYFFVLNSFFVLFWRSLELNSRVGHSVSAIGDAFSRPPSIGHSRAAVWCFIIDFGEIRLICFFYIASLIEDNQRWRNWFFDNFFVGRHARHPASLRCKFRRITIGNHCRYILAAVS